VIISSTEIPTQRWTEQKTMDVSKGGSVRVQSSQMFGFVSCMVVVSICTERLDQVLSFVTKVLEKGSDLTPLFKGSLIKTCEMLEEGKDNPRSFAGLLTSTQKARPLVDHIKSFSVSISHRSVLVHSSPSSSPSRVSSPSKKSSMMALV